MAAPDRELAVRGGLTGLYNRRMGGEEFVAILDGTGRDAAVQIADEVRLDLGRDRVVAA